MHHDQAPQAQGGGRREVQNEGVQDAARNNHGSHELAAGLGAARLLQLPEPVAKPEPLEQAREGKQLQGDEKQPEGHVFRLAVCVAGEEDEAQAEREGEYHRHQLQQQKRRNPEQDAHGGRHELVEIEEVHAVELEGFRQPAAFQAVDVFPRACRSPRVRLAEGVRRPRPHRASSDEEHDAEGPVRKHERHDENKKEGLVHDAFVVLLVGQARPVREVDRRVEEDDGGQDSLQDAEKTKFAPSASTYPMRARHENTGRPVAGGGED